MLEKIKKKENICVFIIILLFSIITCFNFIKFHTVPDTYNVLQQGYDYHTVFLKSGRIISTLYLLLGKLLNIPIIGLGIFSNICSIVFQSICVYIIYKAVTKKENQLISKIIYLIGSYLIIFNPIGIEHLAYIECGIMCLGKLLCVLAAKLLVKNKKLVLPIILVAIASICYQGILNIFISVGLLLILLEENQTMKQSIKKVLKMGLVCIIALITIVLAIKLGNYILGETQEPIYEDNDILIKSLIIGKISLGVIFDYTWNYFPKYLITIVIVITMLLLAIYEKSTMNFKYLLLIILTVLSCTLPILIQQGMPTPARVLSAIGGILRNINYYVRKWRKAK